MCPIPGKIRPDRSAAFVDLVTRRASARSVVSYRGRLIVERGRHPATFTAATEALHALLFAVYVYFETRILGIEINERYSVDVLRFGHHRPHQNCAGDGLVRTIVVVAAVRDRLKMLALILLCNICNITRI